MGWLDVLKARSYLIIHVGRTRRRSTSYDYNFQNDRDKFFVAVYFEGLQDKLTQVKDARAALNALRDEHRERLRREAELAERQRQIQMAQKLEIMRQKKQEYLQVLFTMTQLSSSSRNKSLQQINFLYSIKGS